MSSSDLSGNHFERMSERRAGEEQALGRFSNDMLGEGLS